MGRRQCGYCGKYVPEQATQCPFCREELAAPVEIRDPRTGWGRAHIRRGLLYMLMAAVIQYFTSGESALQLPYTILPLVRQYLLPFLFLGGLGLVVYGLYRRYGP